MFILGCQIHNEEKKVKFNDFIVRVQKWNKAVEATYNINKAFVQTINVSSTLVSNSFQQSLENKAHQRLPTSIENNKLRTTIELNLHKTIQVEKELNICMQIENFFLN